MTGTRNTGNQFMTASLHVTILMADHCSSTSVSAAMEFLECANVLHCYALKHQHPLPTKPFRLTTVSVDGLPVTCTGGLILTPQQALRDIEKTDLIIVPGFMFNILSVLPGLDKVISWLQDHAHKDTYIASMCTGAFVTAKAGLLDNKTATTHWIFSEQFKRAFPKVQLKTEQTVTDDGLMLCSAGSTTGSDLLLHIIRKFVSPQLASECSKKLLIDSSERSQTPYVTTQFKKNHQDPDILKVQVWLEKNIQQPIVMDQVASTFGLSLRNFIRRFKSATDHTPIQYLQYLRIERAKHLLESSKLNFDQITQQVGYEDVNSFRRLFKDRTGLSPSEFRKKFEVKSSVPSS